MRVIGVDPGMSGALCLRTDSGIEVEDMPILAGRIDPWELKRIILEWGEVDKVVIEKVNPVFKSSAKSAFQFGEGFGMLQSTLICLGQGFVYALPNKWTLYHGVGSDKDVHRQRAKELWPTQADLFKLKKHDGRADAALIAEWAACNKMMVEEPPRVAV